MSELFNLRKQLTFYGAYHNNPTNVAIHMIFVPTILWTSQCLLAQVPVDGFLPSAHYQINDYLSFTLNISSVFSSLMVAYYYALEPVAALLYTPQMALSLLTATAYAETHPASSLQVAGGLFVVSWIAQFLGHGLAEKRAPALLDNLVQALVLAPFFVHLEVLFKVGYRPTFQKQLHNDINVEITRVRKMEGDKRRAAATKKGL